MKSRKAVSHHKLDKTPVTFEDVTAYFSQEEWKLLHKWQKELYRNLMKEIHQAMISLGPVIAASVFSLRAEENEDVYFVDNQDTNRRSSDDHVSSADISNMDVFSTGMEETLHPRDPLHMERGESSDYLSAGFDSVSFDNSFKTEREDSCLMDDHPLKGSDGTTSPCAGNDVATVMVSVSIKEEEVNDLMGYQDPMEIKNIIHDTEVSHMDPIDGAGRESSTNVSPVFSSLTSESDVHCLDHIDEVCEVFADVNSDPEATIPVAAIGINEEAGTYAMDLVDYQKSPTGYGSTTKNGILGKPVKNKTRPWPSPIEKVNNNVIQSLHKTEGSIHQTWSGSDCEISGEKNDQWQSGCNQQKNSKLHHTMPNILTSETNNKSEKTTRNDNIIPYKPNPQQDSRSFICPESEQTSLSNTPKRHPGALEEKGQCACSECGKRFLSMSDLMTHKRIHTEEKPFHCVICEKSFKQRGNLHRHEILHTGKNPYQCNICGKSFLGMSNLITHKRVHTGEKPFHCAICAKSFNQRGNLQRHQTLHTGKKPYQCNVCGKSYNIKHNLVGHQKIHTKVQ